MSGTTGVKLNKERSFATDFDYDESIYDGSRVQNRQSSTLQEFIKPKEEIPIRKNNLRDEFYDESRRKYEQHY